jgi:hypothetical protein
MHFNIIPSPGSSWWSLFRFSRENSVCIFLTHVTHMPLLDLKTKKLLVKYACSVCLRNYR